MGDTEIHKKKQTAVTSYQGARLCRRFRKSCAIQRAKDKKERQWDAGQAGCRQCLPPFRLEQARSRKEFA
jgi:hypothetical protein